MTLARCRRRRFAADAFQLPAAAMTPPLLPFDFSPPCHYHVAVCPPMFCR
jgi:hypothetical protein